MEDISTAGISAQPQLGEQKTESPVTEPLMTPTPDVSKLLTLLEKQMSDHRVIRQRHLLHQIRGKEITAYPSPVATLTPVPLYAHSIFFIFFIHRKRWTI